MEQWEYMAKVLDLVSDSFKQSTINSGKSLQDQAGDDYHDTLGCEDLSKEVPEV